MQADPHVLPPLASQGGESALASYLRAIRAHRLLVTLVTLATLVGATAWLSLKSDTYESTAQLLVTPLPQDDQTFLGLQLLRDSGDPTRTVQTAATLVESQEAANEAAKRLGTGRTGESVLNAIEVEPQGESNVLAVTARSDNPKIAVRMANEFARASLAVRDRELKRQITASINGIRARSLASGSDRTPEQNERLAQLESVQNEGDPTLALSQAAVGSEQLGAGAPLVLALALMAGLALGSGAAILMELADRRIRTEEELLTVLPLPVLARVPIFTRRERRASEAGVPWYMPPAIREGFRILRAQIPEKNGQRGMSLMLTSATTGDGKTTSAINLAVSLAASGESVILLDFDMRKPDVGRSLNVEALPGLVSLLDSSDRLEDFLRPAPHLPSLMVLPTGTREGDVALIEVINRRLPDLLEQATRMASYVVLDTAPMGEVSDAFAIADNVDQIVIVARPGHSLRGNMLLLRDLLYRGNAGARAGYLVLGETGVATSPYYSYGGFSGATSPGAPAAVRSRSH